MSSKKNLAIPGGIELRRAFRRNSIRPKFDWDWMVPSPIAFAQRQVNDYFK